MEALDVNGKQITGGLQVKYIRTHTIGKVDKISFKDNTAWIKLDSSGLYYRSDYIEIVECKEYIKSNKRQRRKKSEQFKVRIPIVISEVTDGPGVGGG